MKGDTGMQGLLGKMVRLPSYRPLPALFVLSYMLVCFYCLYCLSVTVYNVCLYHCLPLPSIASQGLNGTDGEPGQRGRSGKPGLSVRTVKN